MSVDIIATIEGCHVFREDSPVEKVSYVAKAAIDGDGSGSSHGDPDFQGDTSLHHNGQPLNSDIDRYIVVPPAIINGTNGIVLGCRGIVTHTLTGMETAVVVGDIGPHLKLGEVSIATARALWIDPSPTSGGEDRHVISYEIYPGQAALGYTLKPS